MYLYSIWTNQINSDKEWKFIGAVTSNNYITFENVDYTELSIKIMIPMNNEPIYLKFHLCNNELPNDGSVQLFTNGSYINESFIFGVTIEVCKTHARLVTAYFNKNDVMASSTFEVRYR